MKKLLLGAVLAAMMAAPVSAAELKDMGTLKVGQSNSFSKQGLNFSTAGTFTDTIKFTIASNNYLTSLTVLVNEVANNNKNITGWSLVMDDNNPATSGPLASGTFGNSPLNGMSQVGALSVTNGVSTKFGAGTYTVFINGNVVGTGNGVKGTYGVSALATVAAVPEPGEWAMLLAGLGVIGFVANRRRNVA